MRIIGAIALLAGLAALPSPADAAPRSAEERQERVRRQHAEVERELDLLRATDDEVSDALTSLEADVAREQSVLLEATAAADRARSEAQDARLQEALVFEEIQALEAAVRRSAVLDFMAGGSITATEALLGADDVATATRAREMVDAVSARDIELVEDLGRARRELVVRRRDADRAKELASTRQQAIGEQVGAVEDVRDEQAQLAGAVEERIAGRLAEAAALQQVDAQLAGQIEAEQQALDARLAVLGVDGEDIGGVTSTRDRPVPSLLRVGGIVVNERMAGSVRALLMTATADGIDLGGGGFRNPAQQVELRRAHCGTSDFAIYRMSASRCSPPTAPPGESMHERGLAIDFTFEGTLISSRRNRAFQWLRANARRFGLRNLPSEPWHWSVNGH